MRRAERLADIVEIVRDGRLHAARELAAALSVSERTVYRDMDALVASGVPVEGERGVGYLLREPVFLPPLAMSLIELEALSLGMAIVGEAADAELGAAARSLMAKLEGHASVRRRSPASWGFGVYELAQTRAGLAHMPLLRRAIRERLTLAIVYRSLTGEVSERDIRPLQIDYWGRVWTCSAWCELRGAFRAFRVDLIETCTSNGRTFKLEPGKTIEDYLKLVAEELDRQQHS
ncbi:helix-turn-helix transcriptional regulator [Sphingomonas sp. CCH5-D11]|jgi:predicted DNA-binding transcriptional regulator YafY|uniref:helix-turn-helix transcriptional regulator n=1 Tax=Sphingomonas sp. CCH5-D11 TaxID=1768786 RepID=UPI00082EDEDE|nr:WYL domain-containing protein [Sphingomonas sp. CCH5-D11]